MTWARIFRSEIFRSDTMAFPQQPVNNMKTCTGCNVEKPLHDYYKHPSTLDGHASKCKECAKAIVKSARLKNQDHYKAFDKARAMRPDRVAARAAYQKTESGREAVRRAKDAYKARLPRRRAAHVAVGNAVRDGRLVPWPVCALPECNRKPQAHHPDYDRPLDVVWLCPTHHKQAHALSKT